MLINQHGQGSLALDDCCEQQDLAYDAKAEALMMIETDATVLSFLTQ